MLQMWRRVCLCQSYEHTCFFVYEEYWATVYSKDHSSSFCLCKFRSVNYVGGCMNNYTTLSTNILFPQLFDNVLGSGMSLFLRMYPSIQIVDINTLKCFFWKFYIFFFMILNKFWRHWHHTMEAYSKCMREVQQKKK